MKKTLLSIALITTITSFTSFGQEEESYSKFAVKFSPTQLIFGELHFAFEHRIAPHSSFEISAGPTISEIGGTFIITDSEIISNNPGSRESDLGYFVGIAYRFYPLNYAEAPRGLYISPEIKYRVYNTVYKDVNGFNLSDKRGSTTQAMFRFNIGYQFWPGKKFALDVFTGIGIGTVNQEKYFSTTTYNSNGTYSGNWVTQNSNRASANATFGIKIGIGH